MGKCITVVPAYGRDYKSKKQVQADLDTGKDFTIMDYSSPWDGKYANKESLLAEGYDEVRVRYQRQSKVTVIKL